MNDGRTTSADYAATGQTAVGQAAAGQAVVGHRFVVIALAVAVLLCLPGIAGRLGLAVDPASNYGVLLAQFWAVLDDIRFGSGLRFWLGVGGTIAMALLLLYPLRKAMAGRRFLGSIAAWFKVHLLIGIFAPVAILYHTNFSTGGLNANVALWTMLAVAASGIVGHFVYARASAAYYGDKLAARRNLDAALTLIASLGGAAAQRDQLAVRLDAFDAEQVAPRSGIRAAFIARKAVRRARQQLIIEAITLVDTAAREQSLAPRLHSEARAEVAKLLQAYFAFAGRASSRSVREQVWARWRMFHLPLFLVMCGATALHVVAVWDMDGPAERVPPVQAPAPKPSPVAVKSTRDADVASAVAIQQVRRATVPIDAQASAPDRARVPVAAAKVETPSVPPVARPQPKAPPAPIALPAPVPRPTQSAAAPAQPPPPAIAVVPSPPRASDKPEPGKQLYEELQKRIDNEPPRGTEPRMALGGTRSLGEQIETFKAKMRTREFKHSDAETGFALTGKHTRADCTDCHTVPLKEVRSESPRQCVACHKKDDVHKGRRPDCADCHTTASFRDRSKRKK